MTNKYFTFIALFVLALLPFQGRAQDCNILYETIYEMPEPSAGSYNVWERVFGDEKKTENFTSGISLSNKNTLVIGSVLEDRFSKPQMIMAELDRRGRSKWSKTHVIEGFVRPVKIIEHDDKLLVIADVEKSRRSKNTKIWVGLFDTKGELLSTSEIAADEGSISAVEVIKKSNASGFFLSAYVVPPKSLGGFARIYDLDNDGKEVRERSFVPGLENKILSLDYYGDGQYVAAGYVRNADGRKVGWVLRLGASGEIIWEREFPRGRIAQINAVSDYVQNFVVMAGESHPYGEGNLAAWVMVLDGDNGQIAWQRYYRGDLDYAAKGVSTSSTGLMSALLTVKIPKGADIDDMEGKQDYARLITLNPRGVLFSSDEYFNGDGSTAHALIMGSRNERIIIGETKVTNVIKDPKTGLEVGTEKDQQGWVVAASSMEEYKDPCVKRSFDDR